MRYPHPIHVKFISSRRESFWAEEPIPRFTFDHRASWLGKKVRKFLIHVATQILKACGARSLAEQYRSIPVMEVDTMKVADDLMKAQHVLLCEGASRDWFPAVLAGPDVIETLEEEMRQSIAFMAPAMYRTGYRTWNGIKIIYVPWMRGGFIPVTHEMLKQMNEKAPNNW